MVDNGAGDLATILELQVHVHGLHRCICAIEGDRRALVAIVRTAAVCLQQAEGLREQGEGKAAGVIYQSVLILLAEVGAVDRPALDLPGLPGIPLSSLERR